MQHLSKEHNPACTYARFRNGTIPAALFLFLLSDASREWTALSWKRLSR